MRNNVIAIAVLMLIEASYKFVSMAKPSSLTPKFHVDALRAQHEYCLLGTHSVGMGATDELQKMKTAFGRERMILSSC